MSTDWIAEGRATISTATPMPRIVTPEDVLNYEKDGVVLIRDAVEPRWVDRLRDLAEEIMAGPSKWASDTGNRSQGRGRALDDRYLWRENDDVRRFVFDSGVAAIVGQAMGSQQVRFYYDHWFMKQPGDETETPWHQDVVYWPFEGRQIASLWLALSEVDRSSSALQFVKGSHQWGKRYKPRRFVKSDPKLSWLERGETADGESVPDIDAHRDSYDILSESLKPGDALVFSAWLLHAAPSNRSSGCRIAVSTRFLGDDARWQPHPAADPTIQQSDVDIEPGSPAHDDDRFPVVWARP